MARGLDRSCLLNIDQSSILLQRVTDGWPAFRASRDAWLRDTIVNIVAYRRDTGVTHGDDVADKLDLDLAWLHAPDVQSFDFDILSDVQ